MCLRDVQRGGGRAAIRRRHDIAPRAIWPPGVTRIFIGGGSRIRFAAKRRHH
jgi:hypothetical protein